VVTDGIATRGLTDKEGLANVARKARTVYRIHVSAVGVGEAPDEDVLQRIVKDGWGFLTYVRGASDAARVGYLQKLEVLRRAAEQIELRLRAARDVEVQEVLNYQAFHSGGSLAVPLDQAGPGDAFQVVLRLRVNVPPRAQGTLPLATAELGYPRVLSASTRGISAGSYTENSTFPPAAAAPCSNSTPQGKWSSASIWAGRRCSGRLPTWPVTSWAKRT